VTTTRPQPDATGAELHDVIGHAAVVAAVAPLHAEARISSHQISQRLAGAPLDILEDAGDWVRVRGADEYEGWMHRGYLTTDADVVAGVTHGMLSLGCTVRTAEGRERPLPLGARVAPGETVVEGEVISDRERAERFPPTAQAIADSAVFYFTGASYQWGGVTPWGADCSGFTQAIYGLHGVVLPRDAWQQSLLGRNAGRDILALQPADLLFFSDREDRWITHVALALGERRVAHIALGRGGWALERVDDEQDAYVAKLRERFLFARRVLYTPSRTVPRDGQGPDR
jgi:gamma-D-glutamyl-L-lysine dipeptidyl-peptidase